MLALVPFGCVAAFSFSIVCLTMCLVVKFVLIHRIVREMDFNGHVSHHNPLPEHYFEFLLECFKYGGFWVLSDVWIFDMPRYDPYQECERRI